MYDRECADRGCFYKLESGATEMKLFLSSVVIFFAILTGLAVSQESIITHNEQVDAFTDDLVYRWKDGEEPVFTYENLPCDIKIIPGELISELEYSPPPCAVTSAETPMECPPITINLHFKIETLNINIGGN